MRIFSKDVLVYNGRGTSSVAYLILMLQKILTGYSVYPVGHDNLTSTEWFTSTSLLIIPGGREEYYAQDLIPKASDRIKEWISEYGGSYLGICAGSYFASSMIEFEINRQGYEYKSNNTLALTAYTAVGSVSENYTYNSLVGATDMFIHTSADDEIFSVYVNGGPEFINPSLDYDENVHVIANYNTSGHAAIIQTWMGKGTAILSGPHFEIGIEEVESVYNSIKNTTDSYRRLKEIMPGLRKGEWKRELVFIDILKRLGLVIID